ncbi:MAG: excinuclease ABC subunit UvrC [Clostridiaceae bacterium]
MFDFDYQLKILPEKSGVYIMKNNLGEVIYVGKAKVLKNRVRQYFQKSKNHPPKVRAMVKNIAEFEFIVTDSEMEALILECNLIKKYRPKYNILLKDDKQYPYIKVTVQERFPRVIKTRKYVRDGSRYFGPYTDLTSLYEMLDLIRRNYPLRTCNRKIEGKLTKPCLNYPIGLCRAPCANEISEEDYGVIVKDVILLLNGNNKNIINELKEKMQNASDSLNFERAAEIRDKIKSIEKASEKQNIINNSLKDEDFISIYSNDVDSGVFVLMYRQGKVIGNNHYIFENTKGIEQGEILRDFVLEYYNNSSFIPKDIYIDAIKDIDLVEEYLENKKNAKVTIKIPQKGSKRESLNLSRINAKLTLEQFKLKLLKDKEEHKKALVNIAGMLDLDQVPFRIESYDISNIMGVDSVGSMVVFENGKPKNQDYRRFKIKTVTGANDYESMKEILLRRFKRGIEETKAAKENLTSLGYGKFSYFPDLIMMDGGKIQVNAALEVLSSLNINIPVCGMVKDDMHNTRGLIYNNKEINLNKNSKEMKLIERVQDEVHRFAISYHRSLRDKNMIKSVLDDIPFIGKKRKKELLKKFKSIDKIRYAEYDELINCPSIDNRAAESISQYFKKEGRKDESKN